MFLTNRWLNCSIEIVNEEKYQWGEIFQNGSGVGVIGDVVIDRADVGICEPLLKIILFYKQRHE